MESSYDEPTGGPARRVHPITPTGRDTLEHCWENLLGPSQRVQTYDERGQGAAAAMRSAYRRTSLERPTTGGGLSSESSSSGGVSVPVSPWPIRLVGRLGRQSTRTWLTLGLVTSAVVFTFAQLQPHLLLADTTPTGGDMGAHVWGPAYLRDNLLPQGRLSGWAPDWYAGFPAYHFYMVVPSLFIVALDVLLPYGVAFKLISVSGLLTLPVAAWALGRLARMPFPTPPLLALGTLPFLFSPLFTIYGGNVASTLAGEFAFSISLSVALVFLGLVLRGLDTGRRRVWAAVVLALCMLCHVIPAIFAVVGAAVALLLRAGKARLGRLVAAGIVGALLTSFWTVPFLLRRPYMNDMGWTKLTTYWENLFPGRLGIWLTQRFGGEGVTEVRDDVTLVALLALVGLVASVVYRRRLGIFLGVLAGVFGVLFVLAPQGRLWNARLLPFWYLCLYLLAAVAVAEVILSVASLVSRRLEEPSREVLWGAPALAALAVLISVGLPLRSLPFGQESPDGSYSWAGLTTSERSFVPGWVDWNYSGVEGKDAYPEYQALMSTMGGLGSSRGCGRAMWEYDSKLNRYGTTMALMLLPYWTDGCIDSMEGLYFESSMTTPFHFLNQSELSAAPSRPQRDLPYTDLDISEGVEHLQLLGVRYYMAFSDEAVAQAEAEPDLSPVAGSGPWKVYEVAGASLVEPLSAQPVVLPSAAAGGEEWLDPAVEWYGNADARDVFLAADGPSSWARVAEGETPGVEAVPAAAVSGVETTSDTISFTVDRPGTPVLVKSSYFPNWQAEGAEGPYRVTPNLMVVVPSATEVTLRYEDTPVDRVAQDLTMLGVIGLVLLGRGLSRPASPRRPDEDDAAEGRGDQAEAGQDQASLADRSGDPVRPRPDSPVPVSVGGEGPDSSP